MASTSPPTYRASDSTASDLDQIRKDIPRTFPDQPVVQCKAAVIESILAEHAVFDPELGYCQGMSCVAAVIVAQLAEPRDAGAFFRRLIDGLRGLWMPGFPLLLAGAAAFDAFQRRSLPRLHAHIHGQGASYDMFLPDAWLTLFSRWMPFHALYGAFIFIEAEGLAAVLALTAALLQAHASVLFKAEDFTALFVLLKSLARQPHQPDTGELLASARRMLPAVRDVLPEYGARKDSQGISRSPTCGSLVRRGTRVLHAETDVEAVLDESMSEAALQRLARRTLSMQSSMALQSPCTAVQEKHRQRLECSRPPWPWLFAECAWCGAEADGKAAAKLEGIVEFA